MKNPTIEFIRSERRRRLWSMRKLAREAHMSAAYLSQMENGKRPLTARATGQIADAFRMPTYELLSLAGFIPAEDLERARTMAKMALAEVPAIAEKARGETEAERLDWLVVDYLYLLGHDPYGTGWDGTPGHGADWRLVEPDAPPPILERLKPEIEEWKRQQAELAKKPLAGWDELSLGEKQLVQELVDTLIQRRTRRGP